MTKIATALAGCTDLGLDTAPVIYFVEEHPAYDALVTSVLQRVDRGEIRAHTSTVTLAEVLVQPLRATNLHLLREYRDLLMTGAGLHMLSVTPQIAERAAELRAKYGLRIPDAIQVATAIQAGCQAILTNDSDFKRVTELKVLILDELEL